MHRRPNAVAVGRGAVAVGGTVVGDVYGGGHTVGAGGSIAIGRGAFAGNTRGIPVKLIPGYQEADDTFRAMVDFFHFSHGIVNRLVDDGFTSCETMRNITQEDLTRYPPGAKKVIIGWCRKNIPPG